MPPAPWSCHCRGRRRAGRVPTPDPSRSRDGTGGRDRQPGRRIPAAARRGRWRPATGRATADAARPARALVPPAGRRRRAAPGRCARPARLVPPHGSPNGRIRTGCELSLRGRGRDASGLHHELLVGAEPHDGAPGPAPREPRRGRGADHVDRLCGILHSQRDAQVGVGPDVVADGMARPLGRQDEVHTEAPASLRDADEGPEELGQLRREGGELVDHHHQPGQAARRAPAPGRRPGRRPPPRAAALRGVGARRPGSAGPARRGGRRGR